MQLFKHFLQLQREQWVFTTALSPEEAIARLQREVEPRTMALHPVLCSRWLFFGEVQHDHFTLTECSNRKQVGAAMTGVITKTPTGSEIMIRFPASLSDGMSRLLLLVLIGIGLGLSLYIVVSNSFPMYCLLIPLLFLGVFVVVLYAATADAPPWNANLEGHLRRIFAVTTPTVRTIVYE
jgi:hypothetical protein